MTEKKTVKKVTSKKTPAKKATTKKVEKVEKHAGGAPTKYTELLKDETWSKIEELTKICASRNYIANFFGVNKDTFLKAIREKGFEDWKDFQEFHFEGIRSKIKSKYFSKIIDDKEVSEKLLIHCMDKYVLPFEEFNKKQRDNEHIKVMYVPISSYNDPKELANLAEQQQKEIAEAIKRQQEEITKNLEDKNV